MIYPYKYSKYKIERLNGARADYASRDSNCSICEKKFGWFFADRYKVNGYDPMTNLNVNFVRNPTTEYLRTKLIGTFCSELCAQTYILQRL